MPLRLEDFKVMRYCKLTQILQAIKNNSLALIDLWTGSSDVCPNVDVMEKAFPTALASFSVPKILP